jgi:hypothetical protein
VDYLAAMMQHRLLALIAIAPFASSLHAQTEAGPYARIAVLRPHDGKTVEFEAGYSRHLDWHRQAQDKSVWYGWSVWAGERQRWLVYATFGHSAASLGSPVRPADDELDNILNVTPHAHFVENGVYEFLPALSRGDAVPKPTGRVELTTVQLGIGAEKVFEAAVASRRATLEGEALWYRMVAGGSSPRYLRLRPFPDLAAILDAQDEQALPEAARRVVAKTTLEILVLRPTLSYGLAPQ